MKRNILLLMVTSWLAGTVCIAQPPQRKNLPPQLPLKDVMAHDPVMAKEGDTYYLFYTGMGISVMSSKNLYFLNLRHGLKRRCQDFVDICGLLM